MKATTPRVKPRENCDNCRFGDIRAQHVGASCRDDRGERWRPRHQRCVRYPPNVDGKFPVLWHASSTWCGEYKRKDDGR